MPHVPWARHPPLGVAHGTVRLRCPGQRPGAFHARPLSLWWRYGYVVKTAGWPRMALPTVARAPRGVSCGLLEETLMECSPSRCFITLILSLLMVPGDVGWRWTGGAGGEKRAPPGCPEGTASGRATWARERAA